MLYSAALKPAVGAPPAIPHASYTGAWPGARHGLKRQKSCSDPKVVCWFVVLYSGAIMRSAAGFGRSGHASRLGTRAPLPSHASHPMVHPLLNQNMDCPLLHVLVPFVQVPSYGMIQPVGGCLPPDQGVPGI